MRARVGLIVEAVILFGLIILGLIYAFTDDYSPATFFIALAILLVVLHEKIERLR